MEEQDRGVKTTCGFPWMFPLRLFLLDGSCSFVQQLCVSLATSPLGSPTQCSSLGLNIWIPRLLNVWCWLCCEIHPPLHQHSASALAWMCGICPLFTCKHMPELQLRLVTKDQDLLPVPRDNRVHPSVCVPSSQLFQINMTGLVLAGYGWKSGRIKSRCASRWAGAFL